MWKNGKTRQNKGQNKHIQCSHNPIQKERFTIQKVHFTLYYNVHVVTKILSIKKLPGLRIMVVGHSAVGIQAILGVE